MYVRDVNWVDPERNLSNHLNLENNVLRISVNASTVTYVGHFPAVLVMDMNTLLVLLIATLTMLVYIL